MFRYLGVLSRSLKARSDLAPIFERFYKTSFYTFEVNYFANTSIKRWDVIHRRGLNESNETVNGERSKRVISRKAAEHLRTSLFISGLEAASEREAIEKMLSGLSGHPSVIDLDALSKAIFARQQSDPPIFPGGIAFPHARTDSVRSLVLVTATCPHPVHFAGLPIRVIFLIGVPKIEVADYLEITSLLARHVREGHRLDRLVEAQDLPEFLEAFA
jgi:mannitol/fructose-specific phosphotransferase system IIA component (Ntr-type)